MKPLAPAIKATDTGCFRCWYSTKELLEAILGEHLEHVLSLMRKLDCVTQEWLVIHAIAFIDDN